VWGVSGVCIVLFRFRSASCAGDWSNSFGTVTDASGAVIANAQVSIRKRYRNLEDTTTDSAGFLRGPEPAAGPYEVKVTAADSILWSRMSRSAVGAQQLSTYR